MVLLYMWLKQGISDFDNLVLAITWIFYFIIMPFIISMLNKTEFFNAIFYAMDYYDFIRHNLCDFIFWVGLAFVAKYCSHRDNNNYSNFTPCFKHRF